MTRNFTTFEQLDSLLCSLGFIRTSGEHDSHVFRHLQSSTVLFFRSRKKTDPARNADLASARHYLVENGLLDDNDFDTFLSEGALPVGS